MENTLSLGELRAAVSDGKIDTVLVCMTDMQGRLIGKFYGALPFLASCEKGFQCIDYLLANDMNMELVPGYEASGLEKGYGDFTLKPDFTTLRRVPWLEKSCLVLCDCVDPRTGEELAHSPRTMLKNQIGKLKEMNLNPLAATELEFYLFDSTPEELAAAGYRNLKTVGHAMQDYHILQGSKIEPLMRDIREKMNAAGIPVENSTLEWGPGQTEVNIRYGDALTVADNHTILKYGIKLIAAAHGKTASFIAKWNNDFAGSSSHVHLSLENTKDSTPAFFDPADPYGMSDLMKNFLAGQIKHAADYTWFLAPFVNSYKRFRRGSLAPTNISWSVDNRTAGFRVCAPNDKSVRFECRIGGSDLNPYLALAAILAAGTAGLKNKEPLPPEFKGDAYAARKITSVPATLNEARQAMLNSDFLKKAFSEKVIKHYARNAEWESEQFNNAITDWEITRYLEQS